MDRNLAIKVNDNDNVATIFAQNTSDGSQIEVVDKKGQSEMLKVIGNIPYGHKIALSDIAPGAQILKYGESIGAASKAIKKGEYVHVHNLDSMRGRGDL
ncbi:MAG: UxaA family hydrolase [Deltaproteobacteria bacterium]|jgi:altronate dehydratase small subunit|nr:UxaA family hydrolase [Deltaproteobacteria bacterium]